MHKMTYAKAAILKSSFSNGFLIRMFGIRDPLYSDPQWTTIISVIGKSIVYVKNYMSH